jgi:hypothetical protein
MRVSFVKLLLDGKQMSTRRAVMAFPACEPLGVPRENKNYITGSFTAEVLENTELSQWLKPEGLLLNTFLSVHIQKPRNSMCNAIGKI